ncbi:MAG: peptidoglycan editing factor PgeF [Alphaproteobacteria bacterium]|nr:peptidoglycan editing factor PgeF [Alphaproteobacteria bacterium]
MTKIETFKHPFLTQPNIQHGFFTRKGGISTGPFASLNITYSSGDDPIHIVENRKRALEHLGLNPQHLIINRQIHSNRAIYVHKPFTNRDEEAHADGLVTDQPNLALAVVGADCPPVLFADHKQGIIGAAHAGWKGALSGILESTIDLMIEKGAKLENINAIIGPAIDQDSYEISLPFFNEFHTINPNYDHFFKKAAKENHFYFNLKGFCAERLKQKGLHYVDIMPFDTYSNPLHFFSYRRTCHLNETKYGNNLNIIALIN